MTDVTGRTAFITGGANGIGLGIARAFAGAGAKLVLVDLDAAALARAKAELSAQTPTETYALDVRDREAYARVADAAEGALGPVSLLVNNAGVAGAAPAAKLTYELWDWGIGINLGGVINGVQTFLPRMVERGGGGQIVNTASGAGLVAGSSGVLYHTAKFGVVGMTEALRTELEPLGIGCTVLCPGPVATDIIARTRRMQPRRDAPLAAGPEREQGQDRVRRMTDILARGVAPDAVGQMVLTAVQENRLYVHTDRIMFAGIEARTRALLAARPPDADATAEVKPRGGRPSHEVKNGLTSRPVGSGDVRSRGSADGRELDFTYTGHGTTPPTEIPIPLAAPSSPVMITNAPFVLAKGQTLYFPAQALLQEGNEPITNKGLIQVIAAPGAAGVAEVNENPTVHPFTNTQAGILSVEALSGGATGYANGSNPVAVVNNGVIQAVALSGSAFGINDYGGYSGDFGSSNGPNGLIAVWAASIGVGVWGYQTGVALDNEGMIYVTATRATGVYNPPTFTNSGSIIATDFIDDGASIGVQIGYAGLYTGQHGQTFTNSGLVQADTAFFFDADELSPPFAEAITLVNSGVIRGLVDFSENSGADTITNTGTIVGAIDCAASSDAQLTNAGLMEQTNAASLVTVLINHGAIAASGTITAQGAGDAIKNHAGGLIESTGDLTLSAPAGFIVNNGVLEANGGVLDVTAPVQGSGTAVIAAGTLECDAAFVQNVAFTGAAGVLELAQSQAYTGTVSGLSTTGASSLDLLDIKFTGPDEASFVDNGQDTGGVLIVTDGEGDTAQINLAGAYAGSTWVTASDGHGGTTVATSPGAGAAAVAHHVQATVANWSDYTGQGATPPTIPIPSVTPSAPVMVKAPLVVGQGQTLYFTGQALLQEGDAPITNAGLIQVIVNGPAAGVTEVNGSSDPHVFINKSAGVLSVEAQSGDATGYDNNSNPVETENKGVIQAVALAGDAYGIYDYGGYGAGSLYNRANGLIAVWASGTGYGVWGYQLGVAVDNGEGLIYVTAGKAVGVTSSASSFQNTGSIIATDIAQDGGSIGVMIGSVYGDAQDIANAGLVQADQAFSSDTGAEPITLVNSGVVRGAINLLNTGTDLITNTGTVVGAIECASSPNAILTNSGLVKLKGGASQLTIIRNQGRLKGEGSIEASIAGGGFINYAGGLIEATGDLTLSAPAGFIVNNGVLEANGGVLDVTAPVQGSGTAVIAAGAALSAKRRLRAERRLHPAAAGVLELAQSQAYTGTVSGLSTTGASSLDLLDIKFTGPDEARASSDNGKHTGGVLTVTDGEGDTAQINLASAYRRNARPGSRPATAMAGRPWPLRQAQARPPSRASLRPLEA